VKLEFVVINIIEYLARRGHECTPLQMKPSFHYKYVLTIQLILNWKLGQVKITCRCTRLICIRLSSKYITTIFKC